MEYMPNSPLVILGLIGAAVLVIGSFIYLLGMGVFYVYLLISGNLSSYRANKEKEKTEREVWLYNHNKTDDNNTSTWQIATIVVVCTIVSALIIMGGMR